MRLFSLEHSKLAYGVDFVLYGAAIVVLATFLLTEPARQQAPQSLGLVLAGLAGWTLIEYLMHRFVLHGLQPFRGWHDEHHRRPAALISAPTILSGTLITTLVFLPALALTDVRRASALTLGVLMGYLAYSVTHHATHHWRADNAWLKQRKRWHAQHHHVGQPGCYGVTTDLWDRVFDSAHRARTPGAR